MIENVPPCTLFGMAVPLAPFIQTAFRTLVGRAVAASASREAARSRLLSQSLFNLSLLYRQQDEIGDENDQPYARPDFDRVTRRKQSSCYNDGNWKGVLFGKKLSEELKKVDDQIEKYLKLVAKAEAITKPHGAFKVQRRENLSEAFEKVLNSMVGALDELFDEQEMGRGNPVSSKKRRVRSRR